MSEPAAWGILRVGGGWVAIFGSEAAAETSRISLDVAENWVHEAVPLFRSPTLTETEREAVKEAADAYGDNNDDEGSARIETALRGLLERTK